jgi:hypothetical protein
VNFDLSAIPPSRLLNAGICVVVAFSGLFFLLSLLGKPDQDSHEYLERRRERNFVFRAFACWVLSWFVWVVLWILETFIWTNLSKAVSLGLSDCNTILIILFYFGLTRGRTYELRRYVIHGIALFLIVLFIIGGLYLLGGSIDAGFKLHVKWSVALSMFSPLLVGWAIKLRYDTDWAIVTGSTYAVAQPLAYEALFGDALADKGDAVLIVLALLKILWATAITYFVGFKPVTSDPVVLPHRETKGDFSPSRMWKILLLCQLVAGVIVTVIITLKYQLRILQGAVGILSIGFLTLIGFITSIKAIASEVQKFLNTQDQKSESSSK